MGTLVERLTRLAARRRQRVDLGITLASVLAIAATGLVVEDLLPLPGHKREWGWWRFGLMVVFLGLLLLLVFLRTRSRQVHGTLYYVRHLSEWMADKHWQAELEEEALHLDTRVVTRWLSAQPVGGVLDVADEVSHLGTSLQSLMNSDDVSTGYTLAPNMLWPSALGLGYEFYNRPRCTLKEYDAIRLMWTLRPAGRPANSAVPEVRWIAGQSVKTVLVTVELTKNTDDLRIQCNAQARYRVALFDGPGDVSSPRRAVTITTDGQSDGEVHPWSAVEVTVKALRAALHRHPDATVFLAGMLPKTVGLAVGWWLRGCAEGPSDPGCGDPHCPNISCHHPWTKLVPLHYDRELTPARYLKMRVHPGQPSTADLAATAAVSP